MEREFAQRRVEGRGPHDLCDVLAYAVLAGNVGTEIGPLVARFDVTAQETVVDVPVNSEFTGGNKFSDGGESVGCELLRKVRKHLRRQDKHPLRPFSQQPESTAHPEKGDRRMESPASLWRAGLDH
ncbi:hypothetical protein SHJG_3931 [Streptomyces hygroscopicus subsp. jinggangensis 5008]|nr:hypothetical protein SHJG_3931 [Streptomyces hygroscopicus subsp. jinggangensis 5008]AGF63361.1 hypothetical protein SHJGH_3696 [Streptomyces hygroscopicus subsp. jinggangensis TL01]